MAVYLYLLYVANQNYVIIYPSEQLQHLLNSNITSVGMHFARGYWDLGYAVQLKQHIIASHESPR